MFYFLAAEFQNILSWGLVPFQQLQVFILDWLINQNYSDFGTEQLFLRKPVEFFAVHQINHFSVACCEQNLSHNLLGQWFIWWMVLLIQSSNSKYLRVWVNYCFHLKEKQLEKWVYILYALLK